MSLFQPPAFKKKPEEAPSVPSPAPRKVPRSNKKQENDLELTDLELKTCWEGLSRVLRQLSKNRSMDWKRGATPVKEKLEEYLKKKGVIT